MEAIPKADILLVDDHPENLLALEAILADLGQNLVKAHSGAEALRLLLQRDFAVILLDVQMPGMDGFEAAALTRERQRSQRTPIIFLTAHHRTDAAAFKGYALGAVDFLFKPLVPEVLRSKVAAFVELYQKTAEVQRQAELLREAREREHERELAEDRRRWEAERLQQEMERERRGAAELARRAEELARTIEERERSEQALRESEERYRFLADAVPHIIWTAGADGLADYCNRRWFEYTGLTLEETRTDGWARVVHPEDYGPTMDRWRRAHTTGEPFEVEYRFRRASDGGYRWHLGRAEPMRDAAGGIVKWFGSATDIDDRKRAEDEVRRINEGLEARVADRTAEAHRRSEQLRRLAQEITTAEARERRRVAAALHDDLAQALAIAKMKLALVPSPPGGAKAAAGAQALRDAQSFLGQAIDYTRGLMQDLSPPMLYDLGLTAAVEGLAERMKRQHALEVEVACEDPEPTVGEEGRTCLFQGIRELLVNAVKYAGVPRARVEIGGSGGEARVVVADAGKGFEPPVGPWRGGDGGFGLFNLRERLDLLGGRMEIDSAPGRGARITLRLPLAAAVPHAAASAGEAPR